MQRTRCLGERQGEGGLHTKSYLVCKDLGCLEHMHKCWSLGECSRLGEIRLEQRRGCERKRQGERRIHTRSYLVSSIRLGMLGAYAQVLELGRVFQTWRDSTCARDQGVLRGRDKVRLGTAHQVLPCMQRLGMLGAYAQVLELGRVFQTWRDST